MFREIYDYREMISSLVKRDLRGRYKGSVLGFVWTFLNPLLQLCVYTIVFSVIMKNGIEKYYLHLFVALVPWLFFSACITSGSSCIISQKDMVKKIYFPREVLPISFVTSQFVNMLFSFVIIFFVILISGTGFRAEALLILPFVMVCEYVVALGMTMLTCGLCVYFRDLQYILSIFSMLWMYLTPVIYPVDAIPDQYLNLYNLNPMTPIIVAFRDILYFKEVPELNTLINALVVGIVVLVMGVIVFYISKKHFAEEL